jgi:hypothetical protein
MVLLVQSIRRGRWLRLRNRGGSVGKGSFDISLSGPPGERPDGGTVDGWLLAERSSSCCGTMREMRESWWNWREGEGVGLVLWMCWGLVLGPAEGRRGVSAA